MSVRRWCALWLLASSCRFGGGDGVSGDPLAVDEPAARDHASADAALGEGGSASSVPAASMGGAPAPARDAGRSTPDARAPTADDGSAPDRDAAIQPPPSSVMDSAASGSCTRPHVEVCDPVTDHGCDPPLQCIIDYASGTLAGYCAFSTPIDGGPFCVSTPVTESCPPSTTCVDGVCRALCFCDDDCNRGECCAEQVGGLGFKLCGAC